MEITKETFIEQHTVLFNKELWKHLPEKAPLTVMLLNSGTIINNLNTHLIAAIHQNIKKED